MSEPLATSSDLMDEAQLELVLEGANGDRWTLEGGETPLGPAHTARAFKKREPVKYATIVAALKNGAGITTLARCYRVSVNTIYAIIDSDLGGREKYHASLVGKLEQVAHLGVDRMIELMPDCDDIKAAAVTVGIAVEKVALLRGLPTMITEVRHTVDREAMDEFNRRFQALRSTTGAVVEEAAHGEAAA